MPARIAALQAQMARQAAPVEAEEPRLRQENRMLKRDLDAVVAANEKLLAVVEQLAHSSSDGHWTIKRRNPGDP